MALVTTGVEHVGVVEPHFFDNGAQEPGAPPGTCMRQRNHKDAPALIGGMKRMIAWSVPADYAGEIGVLAPSTTPPSPRQDGPPC